MIAIAKTTTGPTSRNTARSIIKSTIVLMIRIVEKDLIDEGNDEGDYA